MRALGLIACLGLLLSGCSSQPSEPPQSSGQYQLSQGNLHAQLDPQQQPALQRALKQKGLLLPTMLLTDQYTLAPDYPTSALQWAGLQQRLGLQLDSAGRSMRRFRYLLKEVNERCPELAKRPSSSCRALSLFWLDGFSGNGALSSESLIESALNDKAAYLILPNPDLYTQGLMRHAQAGLTTAPMTTHPESKRRADLSPQLGSSRLELWLPDASQAAFSCRIKSRDRSGSPQQQWQRLQQELLPACEPALAALLGLEINEIPPSLNERQQQKLQQLLQKKDHLFQ